MVDCLAAAVVVVEERGADEGLFYSAASELTVETSVEMMLSGDFPSTEERMDDDVD